MSYLTTCSITAANDDEYPYWSIGLVLMDRGLWELWGPTGIGVGLSIVAVAAPKRERERGIPNKFESDSSIQFGELRDPLPLIEKPGWPNTVPCHLRTVRWDNCEILILSSRLALDRLAAWHSIYQLPHTGGELQTIRSGSPQKASVHFVSYSVATRTIRDKLAVV